MGEQGEDGLQDRGSSCNWMPTTPFRPILPKLPHSEVSGMASKTVEFGVGGTRGNHKRVVINFGSPDREEESGFVYHGAGVGVGSSDGTSTEAHFHSVEKWRGVSCKDLLVLAEASAAAGNDSGVMLGEIPRELPFRDQHPRDRNFPPASTYGQFAPITPDKSVRVGGEQMSQIPNSNARGQELEEHWDANSATMENNKDVEKSAPGSPHAAPSTQLQGDYNSEKGVSNIIDLNKMPQTKQRRRKHRPKVIKEGKPKANPKPSDSKETPKAKRKYVRKIALNKTTTPPPPQEIAEQIDSNQLKSTKRSCRRVLNYSEEEPRDGSTLCGSLNRDTQSQELNFCKEGVQSNSSMPPRNGIEMVADNSQAGIAHNLISSTNQMLKDYLSLPEQSPSTPDSTRNSSIHIDSQKEDTATGRGHMSTPIGQVNSAQTMLDCATQSSPQSPHEEEQAKGSKRKFSNGAEQEDSRAENLVNAVQQFDPRMNLIGANYNNMQAYYKLLSWVHFPYIYKKKRTDKAQNSTIASTSYRVTTPENLWRPSTSSYLTSCPQFNASPAVEEAGKGPQDKLQAVESILPLYQAERSTKRRSRGPTRVRDLASLTRTPELILHRTYLSKHQPGDGNGQTVQHCYRTQTCIDALVTDVGATLAKKKRTKRNPLSTSQRSLVIYKNQPYFGTASGVLPEVMFEQLLSAITEHLKCLDINRESSRFAYQGYNVFSSYKTQNQDHNALVLYRRDGTVVSFDGPFDPIKKRRARPKVDLDQETDRVWKLLMDNINSEGIDGTDEQKAKWWEEERRVFHGRADSFIARMHLVQGDRRFSPWKGSVVDSVVGVFLTQNVSDHLSSSAFMSLAAHFPVKPRSNEDASYEEVASLVVDEPEVCISETSNQPACDCSSMTFPDTDHSEEKVFHGYENSGSTTEGIVSTTESECKLSHSSEPGLVNRSTTKITRTVSHCYIEDMRTTYDVISSQNSVDSSTSQTVEKTGSCESNSETEDLPNRCENSSLNQTTSFVELLQKAESTMLHQAYSLRSNHMPSHGTSNCESYQPTCMQDDDQRHDINRQGASSDPSSDCYLTPNPGVQQVECFDLFREVTQSSNTSKNKYEDSLSEKSALTAESASQDTVQNGLTMNVQETPSSSSKSCNNIQVDYNMVQSQIGVVGNSKHVDALAQEQNIKMQQSCLNISGETIDVMQKAAVSDLNEQSHSISKEFSKTYAATSKTSRRPGKEKKEELDWDKLRIQAESNGRKREKTANTMDSLDWEAVRCADVGEIAQTIKERGMNNMLAERIKAFLNRLVTEHGSVDLEWLRDVPPDQAKEYLLSFRGLGLKSVECVRLLTLHHLAFPVDTNVGRIAVRLGWVPLQPLPESLQLHLLELYPVLESIQKYLWPRLCKLDQRTLYELHYQMITFGKVFCTKSKPNCNACPMRGECRHFASAFASARLALPGPEERSIVSGTEARTTYTNPPEMNNRMPLPLPQATQQREEYRQLEASQQLETSQQSEAKSEFRKCEPIVEEPSTPEPEPDCTDIAEDIEDYCDDPEEIPTIKLNMEQFTQNLQNFMQANMELQEGEMSKALVSLTAAAASLPTPKLKNISRLRTEHQVYELPDTHPLLEMLRLEKREPDDPCNYLLAIWTPGETPNSIQPPEKKCSSQELGNLCADRECFACNSAREANTQTVRGTLLVPCRTAMRGSFPLNGTYFQVNEVFADHDSSLEPIDVPRSWLWNLNRRTVYFGTSIPTIFKGLTTPEIQQCFWRGFVCVRGFDQKTRAPRPLMARLHFPASKMTRTKDKRDE